MEQIVIQNFKAIRNTNAVPIQIRKMTIFMGEQASGKSTVAKLIYFFKTLREEIASELIENNHINPQNHAEIVTNRIRRYFVFLFGSSRHLSDFQIVYTFPNNLGVTISKNHKGNLHVEIPRLNPLLGRLIQQKQSLNSNPINFNDLEQRERNRFINNIGASLRAFFGSNQQNLFLPASRNMTVTLEHHLIDIYGRLENTIALNLDLQDSNRFYSENELILLKFMQYTRFLKAKFQQSVDFEGLMADEQIVNPNLEITQARNFIQKVSSIIKGRYASDQYGEKIFFNNSEDYVFVQNASSGQQESIRVLQDIFINLLYGSPVFRVFEEPESHLFASGQKLLIESLAILLNKNTENQIVIPTHSPYILMVIDNLIKAEQLRAEVVESNSWLNFDAVSAYNFVDGEIENALNEEYRGIDARLFDDVTTQVSNQFDELLNIQYP
jgi:hypothetical protein